MSAENIVNIGSRAEFLGAVRDALGRAIEAGALEIHMIDPTFADWPLNEPAVIDLLGRWIDSRRGLTVLAFSFEEMARQQLRFVAWRRQWAHVVHCRSDPDLAAEQIPSMLLVPGVTCIRLLDRLRFRGVSSDRPVDLTACRETIDALLQRSVEAFPVTTLGL